MDRIKSGASSCDDRRGSLKQRWFLLLLLFPFTVHSFTPSKLTRSSHQRLFAGPKSEGRRRRTRGSESRIAEIARDRSRSTVKPVDVPFDGKALTAQQESNEATVKLLDLKAAISDGSLRLVLSTDESPSSVAT